MGLCCCLINLDWPPRPLRFGLVLSDVVSGVVVVGNGLVALGCDLSILVEVGE